MHFRTSIHNDDNVPLFYMIMDIMPSSVFLMLMLWLSNVPMPETWERWLYRLKTDNQFDVDFFDVSYICGNILQFMRDIIYIGLDMFSSNKLCP